MIVSCESCQTKFRLDPDRIKKPRIKVRCSNCGHVFTVAKPDTGQPEEEPVLGFEMPPDDDRDFEADSGLYAPPSYSSGAKQFRKKKRPIGKLIASLLVVLILAGGIYYLIQSGLMGSLIGSSKEVEQTNPQEELTRVTIQENIESFFLDNVHTGQIFVVEGQVINNSTKPISFVMVEGKLYTTGNEVARSQRAYCGNAIPRDDLMQMDMKEIQDAMMNREGKDLANVHIEPGKTIPFMVVFHNLPELDMLSDYSVEVVSAEFES